ncbi:MAG: DUF4349 domain-containing protein [Clostridia bacterium]|nr:DUF4349 domain-containing protein [Clostridia bacterium]
MPDINENEVLRDALSSLNEEIPPMPENLHAAWMQKVEEENMTDNRSKFRIPQTVTRWLSVAAAVVFVIGGTLLTRDDLNMTSSTANQKTAGYVLARTTADYAVEESAEYEYDAADNGVMLTMAKGADAPAPAEKKIIRTASMTIATQTFEDSLNALRSACEGQGGWIESSSESTNSYSGLRTAYLTLRLPQTSLDAYLAGTADLGRITARSESAQDVTESYQDTAARLETQKALMARLQALITESADLADLLALESQIADTQYEIDRLQSSLNSTDRQVTYSTVNITLKEEKTVELTDTTVSFGDRIKSAIVTGFNALESFLSDMVIFLVAALPFILVVAVFAIVIRIIRRRKK